MRVIVLGISVLRLSLATPAALECKLNQYGLLHVGRLDLLQLKLTAEREPPRAVIEALRKKNAASNATDVQLTKQQASIIAEGDDAKVVGTSVMGEETPPQKIEKYDLTKKVKISKEELKGGNGEDDMWILGIALATHSSLVIFLVLLFSMLRKLCPLVYTRHVHGSSNTSSGTQSPGFFGWINDSLQVKFDEVSADSGLDQALLLEYTRVCMRLLRTLALVVFLGMGTINFMFGGGAAGKNYMDMNAFANLQAECWVHWLQAFSVWIVVLIMQEQLYSAQQAFLVHRFKWLRHLSDPRATTVLVEGIPDEYQTDAKFRQFFEKLFGHKVKACWIAKRAPKLQAAFERKQHAVKGLKSADYRWQKVGRDPKKRPQDNRHGDLINYWTKEKSEAEADVKVQREQAKELAKTPGGVNGENGFVTFHNTTDAEIALSVACGADRMEWAISDPPSPPGVLWHDLEQDADHAFKFNVLGYVLTAALYACLLPIILWSTQCAKGLVHLFWAAVLPPLAVQVNIAYLPFCLQRIFKSCFTLNGHGFSQRLLQNWFWVSMVVYVIMIPATGDKFWVYVGELLTSPMKIFRILGESLPVQSHYFLTYAIMLWTTRALEMLRYVNLAKFLWFSRNYPPDVAKDLSEPEDADFYGLGSRHARMTISMNVAIVFSALCPMIILLVMVDFALCRLFYGFLIPFVEVKKSDSGGAFWVRAIEQVSLGGMIYVIVMTGVLYGRASTPGPAIISACCFPFLMYSTWRFENEFLWEKLPFHEHRAKEAEEKRPHQGVYVQPEWIEDDEDTTGDQDVSSGNEQLQTVMESGESEADAQDIASAPRSSPGTSASPARLPSPTIPEQSLLTQPLADPAVDAEMGRLNAEVAALEAQLAVGGLIVPPTQPYQEAYQARRGRSP